jgi:hypothetical protein
MFNLFVVFVQKSKSEIRSTPDLSPIESLWDVSEQQLN